MQLVDDHLALKTLEGLRVAEWGEVCGLSVMITGVGEMSPTLRRVASLGAVLLTALSFVACGGSGPPAGTGDAEPDPIPPVRGATAVPLGGVLSDAEAFRLFTLGIVACAEEARAYPIMGALPDSAVTAYCEHNLLCVIESGAITGFDPERVPAHTAIRDQRAASAAAAANIPIPSPDGR